MKKKYINGFAMKVVQTNMKKLKTKKKRLEGNENKTDETRNRRKRINEVKHWKFFSTYI